MASESKNDRGKEEIKTAKIGPLATTHAAIDSEETAVETKRQQILLPYKKVDSEEAVETKRQRFCYRIVC